ncbi:uncharacterized protein CEXT_502501 [Caerostris extrusa]|uniref:Uncharacterized protein n=1 Tax=Caerostris extrusa TaxID=172846 RepID=A0AAV4SDC4_CAEEX|nr:uncharacterized protein CEXT_502501 [Caerostris extrusa]
MYYKRQIPTLAVLCSLWQFQYICRIDARSDLLPQEKYRNRAVQAPKDVYLVWSAACLADNYIDDEDIYTKDDMPLSALSSKFESRSHLDVEHEVMDVQAKMCIFNKAIEIKIPDPVEKPVENSSEIVSTVASVEENIPVPLSETGRPPIDFFKDIFENSSDDEDLPETQTDVSKTPVIEISENEKESTTPVAEVTDSNEKPIITESKKVGFGVFANLDLDALNQRTPKVKTNSLDNTEIKCETMDISEKSEEENKSVPNISPETSGLSENLYGPELPPDYNESSLPSSSKYVSKKHAKHKHKHQKHKKKRRRRNISHTKSSEESSFDSNEDIPPTIILEKPRFHQTAFSRFLNGHTNALTFKHGQKIFPQCHWCSSDMASPAHVLICLGFDKRRGPPGPSNVFSHFLIHRNCLALLDSSEISNNNN